MQQGTLSLPQTMTTNTSNPWLEVMHGFRWNIGWSALIVPVTLHTDGRIICNGCTLTRAYRIR